MSSRYFLLVTSREFRMLVTTGAVLCDYLRKLLKFLHVVSNNH